MLHVDSLILLLLLMQILQEDALCSKTTPFCAILPLATLDFGVTGALWWKRQPVPCSPGQNFPRGIDLQAKLSPLGDSLSFSATRHFQCHKVPKHILDVNYLSLTVVLGVQEGIELKLPLTMESRGGRREGKKRGGTSPDHSCSLSHTLSSFQLCLFACHNSQREML